MSIYSSFLKRFISLLLLLLGSMPLFASHVAGGEITYECLGGNQYRIRFVFFRDCGGASLPSSATIDIYNSALTLVQNPSLPLVNTTTTNGVAPTPCTVIPNGVCLEIGEYEGIVTLPPVPGGYTLSYDICCRNGGIVNGPAGSAAYYATIPDASLATCNNRAVFNAWPPVFICRGDTFSFDYSATDADGDSLVYSLCTPYESIVPNTPYPFGSGYSAANPIGGVPPLSIDPQTGLMTGLPPNIGRFVVSVCVSEYRNGVLIATSSRDFQLNVVNCQEITVASAISALTNCVTREVTFFNNSTGASTYFWDFGDGVTSTATNPVHTYPAYGNYNVTLIGYNGGNPQCNDTTTAIIALVDTCRPCGMVVNVMTVSGICNALDGCAQIVYTHPCATSQSISYGSGITISGGCGSTSSIGTGSAPLFSQVTVTVDGSVLPTAATTQTITMLGPASPCAGSVALSSPGPGLQTYTFNAVYTEPQTGGAWVNITGGTPPYNVQWTTTPTQSGDTARAVEPGTYNVIVTDANGCVEVVSFVIDGASNMALNATGTNISACGANDGTATVSVAGNTGPVTFLWTPGGYTTQSVTDLAPGFYTVQVTDDSCSTTDTITIQDLANIAVNVTVSDITCPSDVNGSASVISTTGGAGPYSFSWNSTPVQTGPTATGLPFGFYTVVATDQNGCTGQRSFTISGPLAMSSSIVASPGSCATANDGTATLSILGGTVPYNFAWNTSPTQTTTTATALPSGYAVVTITDANSCVQLDSILVEAPAPLNIDLEDLSAITCAGIFTGAATASITGGQPNTVDVSTIYNEVFAVNNAEIGCGFWFTDASSAGPTSIMNTSDYFRVVGNLFEGQDLNAECAWFSSIIDISTEANVTISGDFFECGGMEATDYIRAYYKINGGPEILWFDQTDDGGTDCALNSPSLAGLSGNTIQIVVRVRNDVNGEIHRFDNINVTGNVSGVLYNEPFNTNDLFNEPTCNWWRDVTGPGVNTTVSGAGTTDHVAVRNGALEMLDLDGEVVWYSEPIDISNCVSVDVSMDFDYGGSMNTTEYIRGYYSINGGPEVLWIDHTDDTPAAWPSGNPSTDVLNSLNGNTLQLIVRAYNTGSTDFHSIDNIVVNCSEISPNPYTLAWSCSPAVTDTVTGLPVGICTITATDSAGCSAQNSIDIVNPGVVSATLTAIDACGATANGSATAFPVGGDAPYSFAWSCLGSTTQAVAGLTGGTNCTVSITDGNGCVATQSVAIGASASFVLDSLVDGGTCTGDGAIDLTVLGGTPAYIYSWSTGATTEDVTGLFPNTIYTVAVWDANLCFENLSIFVDSNSCVLLDLTLVNFRGEDKGRFNQLYWETSSETNNDYFVLERSENAIEWSELEIIDAAGNLNITKNYTAIDENPYEHSYYRLRLVDFDGNYSYSNVISIRKESINLGADVMVYPNPVDENLTILLPDSHFEESTISIKIYNAIGQVVWEENLMATGKRQLVTMNTKFFVDAVYFLTIQQAELMYTKKIQVKH